MEAAKIYGLCLERLTHQVLCAKKRVLGESQSYGPILLESYGTGDLEDIIDLLELYDIEARTLKGLKEKLEDLAYTVSELMREVLFFNYTEEGHIGLYLSLRSSEDGNALCERMNTDAVSVAA
ncbi:MAG TPA: hypothetical protein VEI28_01895 [Thermodesulfovibrionales bacterium]|nr:hypothetical protein [Thermodesulfovibrionales bacterium]